MDLPKSPMDLSGRERLLMELSTAQRRLSRFCTYTPPVSSETELNYLKPEVLSALQIAKSLFIIGEKIDRYVQNVNPCFGSRMNSSWFGTRYCNRTAHTSRIRLLPVAVDSQFPVGCLQHEYQWKHCFAEPLVLLQFPFEVNVSVKGEVIAVGSLETPAGTF